MAEPVPHVPPASPLPAIVTAHLGSRDVARTLYGALVGLALVVALQEHPPAAGAMAVLLLATAVTVGLAELYSEAVSLEARTRAPLDRRQLRSVAGEAIAVVVGAGFPAVFFVFAALGAFDVDLAFALSKWSGLALICAYAFLAARLAGATVPRCLVHAAALGLLAGALIALKAVLH
ncbi:MAG: hypothetical protein ABW167_22245 [Baekduia sp.]